MFDLKTGEEKRLPDMNTARASFASTLNGEFIYVFGGRDGSPRLNSCERYQSFPEVLYSTTQTSSATPILLLQIRFGHWNVE